jgi:ubiquitin thioesterase OTU1
MRVRLRGPLGASTITLNDGATVGDLRSSIAEKTALTEFDIKHGYPPKPLQLGENTDLLSSLHVRLDGEQLTVSAYDAPSNLKRGALNDVSAKHDTVSETAGTPLHKHGPESRPSSMVSFAGMPGTNSLTSSGASKIKLAGPVSLKRKEKEMDVPELPLPDRGATMGTRTLCIPD